ncbi:uncharacterized protein PAC_17287 [Phialocephala subalpina]|uniref:Uncharacterized protein n=1 Tax=Phialocephala subalpina TaxID=576137 RepID=A0A1L7XR10_9HELO|nr:uncharacterized protein PAC_17287 [Phialocephala subalpina]
MQHLEQTIVRLDEVLEKVIIDPSLIEKLDPTAATNRSRDTRPLDFNILSVCMNLPQADPVSLKSDKSSKKGRPSNGSGPSNNSEQIKDADLGNNGRPNNIISQRFAKDFVITTPDDKHVEPLRVALSEYIGRTMSVEHVVHLNTCLDIPWLKEIFRHPALPAEAKLISKWLAGDLDLIEEYGVMYSAEDLLAGQQMRRDNPGAVGPPAFSLSEKVYVRQAEQERQKDSQEDFWRSCSWRIADIGIWKCLVINLCL